MFFLAENVPGIKNIPDDILTWAKDQKSVELANIEEKLMRKNEFSNKCLMNFELNFRTVSQQVKLVLRIRADEMENSAKEKTLISLHAN